MKIFLAGLVAVGFCVTPAFAQSVEIELNNTASADDDYLCWAPTPARARLVTQGPTAPVLALRITIAGESAGSSGAVQFQRHAGDRISRDTFSPSDSIALDLTSDGTWTQFWASGLRPSRGEKDVKVVAKAPGGEVVGMLPVMVRVRKNADQLTAAEIGIFMDALEKLHDLQNGAVNSATSTYASIHQQASGLGIHRTALLLPWHRALVLDFERSLQAIDPRVAVPYWRFDKPSNNLFTLNFMGQTGPGKDFSAEDRLSRWVTPEAGRLLRDPTSDPSLPLADETIPDLFDSRYVVFRGQIENRFHNSIHDQVGGWLALPFSPADPLFFLLHANVDRVWGHWQAEFDRFDPDNELSYSAQGEYPGTGDGVGDPKGVYAKDPMWPWGYSEFTEASGWPPLVHKMPQNGSVSVPVMTPGSQIDYLDVHGRGLALGYCYDDIDYLGHLRPASPP